MQLLFLTVIREYFRSIVPKYVNSATFNCCLHILVSTVTLLFVRHSPSCMETEGALYCPKQSTMCHYSGQFNPPHVITHSDTPHVSQAVSSFRYALPTAKRLASRSVYFVDQQGISLSIVAADFGNFCFT
jgi:hypothetical protein